VEYQLYLLSMVGGRKRGTEQGSKDGTATQSGREKGIPEDAHYNLAWINNMIGKIKNDTK